MFIAPPWQYNKGNAGFNQLLLFEDFHSSVCYTRCLFPRGKHVTVCPSVVCGHLNMISSVASLSKPNSNKFTVKTDSCCSPVTSDGFSYKSLVTSRNVSLGGLASDLVFFNINYLKSGQSKVHFVMNVEDCRQ